MAMVPHGRSLVNELAGKPFAYLGVNSDRSKAILKQVVEKHKIPWRSWWDGGDGPIGKAWHCRGLPAIYILDAKGAIRFKDVRGKLISQAVEHLLAEVGQK